MREAMFGGKLTIAGHNTELLEEMRNYHRDEDFKIVKQLDDLISALRYAIASRRHGQAAVGLRGHRLRGPALRTAASSAQSTALAICPRYAKPCRWRDRSFYGHLNNLCFLKPRG